MNRRNFLHVAAASPVLARAASNPMPAYRTVTPYKAAASPGFPGPYKGQVTRVYGESSIDPESEKVDSDVVRQMISQGMRGMTGDKDERDAWARFFGPHDIIGLKVNCSGAPNVMTNPEIVADIVQNLISIDVPPKQIYIYEKFRSQMDTVRYEQYVPDGVHVVAAEESRGAIVGYDPDVYVETDFFGEEDTRSFMLRIVSETLTKIINLPNMKEHQAAGVTGCLKNISYGHFSNVDRSHRWEKTNTDTYIGTLAAVEPIPSKTVLNIMDGLRGVWHAGPFSREKKFRFFPKQMMFGTDPIAMDRLLIDVIEDKRKAEGAPSVFDRSKEHIRSGREVDPSHNRFIREPGHIKYATRFDLGVYDIGQIKIKRIDV
ncbi:MAG: DUF362 domain-containing protein [Acidobacteria bacterium]|nr:DUF362 domain-containing protein [Acidobacteriota bacterium]